MTQSDGKSLSISEIVAGARILYRIRNNNGEGFAPASESKDVNDLPELGTIIHRATSTDDVAVYVGHDGFISAVGDASGPWVVNIS